MVLVPRACLIWGPAFEMCNINILLFVFSAVISPENTGQLLSCVQDLTCFSPFWYKWSSSWILKHFMERVSKALGIIVSGESGMYPGVRVTCLSSLKGCWFVWSRGPWFLRLWQLHGPGVVFEPSDTTFLWWSHKWGWINIALSCHAAWWVPIHVQSFIQFTSRRKVVTKMSFKINKYDNAATVTWVLRYLSLSHWRESFSSLHQQLPDCNYQHSVFSLMFRFVTLRNPMIWWACAAGQVKERSLKVQL